MSNPLERSIYSAFKANERLGALFARMGTSEHPRGTIITAYRNALRAMRSALQETRRASAAGEVMAQLRTTLSIEVRRLLTSSQELGLDEASRQLRYYSVTTPDTTVLPVALSMQTVSALAAILARHDAQAQVVQALALMGHGAERVIGDENRQGVLRPGDVLAATAFWLAALAWDAWTYQVNQYGRDDGFRKQAVAALDNRTTDCCLRVHGQVQPLNKKFHLTGEPRYADEIDWPPFHGYCRTSVALYQAEYDDGLTERMRSGADKILDERARGIRRDRYPVDAFG